MLQLKKAMKGFAGDFKAPHHRGYKILLYVMIAAFRNSFLTKQSLKRSLLHTCRARIQREKEEAEKAEQARIAAEKARKHKEWLASPEYKAMRKKQDKIAAICGGVVAVLIVAGLVISGNSGKNEPENNQSGIHSSLVA